MTLAVQISKQKFEHPTRFGTLTPTFLYVHCNFPIANVSFVCVFYIMFIIKLPIFSKQVPRNQTRLKQSYF
jgi:hypothetical protein